MMKRLGREKRLFSEILYHLLLQFYPPAFRREYGEWMQQAYRDLRRVAWKNDGNWGVVRLWGRIMADFSLTVFWEHLDDYQRSDGMKKIIVEEVLRALAIGWGSMILLSFFYRGAGWSSELVLLLAAGIGLLSFTGFTLFRLKSGRELKVRTRRGWIIMGIICGLILLTYYAASYNRTLPFPGNIIPILIAFLVLVSGVWWGLRHAQNEE